MKTHVEISVLSSLRIQQVKKKKRKRSSLQKLTHFFVRHSSFERKKEYDVEASPYRSFRYDSRTIVPWIPKANPESVARRQTGTMRILGAGAKTNYAYGYRPLIERVSSPASLQTPYLFEYGGVIPRVAGY